MVGSNSTCSNPKRRSLPWIARSKGKADKSCFCKLQSPDGRRRYLRRGSKTSKMLQAAKNELDESGHTCYGSPHSSTEFSMPSGSQEFSLGTVREADSSSAPTLEKSWENASSTDRKRHSVSLLTSALAIASLTDSDSEGDE